MSTVVQKVLNASSKRTARINRDVRQIRAATKRLATDSVDAVRQTANDLVDGGRTQAHDVAQIAQSKMQENPVKSILLATAVGFLFGVFWRRR